MSCTCVQTFITVPSEKKKTFLSNVIQCKSGVKHNDEHQDEG